MTYEPDPMEILQREILKSAEIKKKKALQKKIAKTNFDNEDLMSKDSDQYFIKEYLSSNTFYTIDE